MRQFSACLNPLFLFSSFWETCCCPRNMLSPQGRSATLSCGSLGVFLMTRVLSVDIKGSPYTLSMDKGKAHKYCSRKWPTS